MVTVGDGVGTGVIDGAGAEFISNYTRVLEDEILVDLVSELFRTLADNDDDRIGGTARVRVSAVRSSVNSSETDLRLT